MSKRLNEETYEFHDAALGVTRLFVEILQLTIDEVSTGIANLHLDSFTFNEMPVGELTQKGMISRVSAIDSGLFLKSDGARLLLENIEYGIGRSVSIEWVMRAVRHKARLVRRRAGGRKAAKPRRANMAETRTTMLRRKILEILENQNLTTTEVCDELNNELMENLQRYTVGEHLRFLKSENRASVASICAGTIKWQFVKY